MTTYEVFLSNIFGESGTKAKIEPSSMVSLFTSLIQFVSKERLLYLKN